MKKKLRVIPDLDHLHGKSMLEQQSSHVDETITQTRNS